MSAKNVMKSSLLDLLKQPKLRPRTCCIYLTWFVTAFVYYGLSLNTNNLGGNPYYNFLVSGAVEFPAYVLCIIVSFLSIQFFVV